MMRRRFVLLLLILPAAAALPAAAQKPSDAEAEFFEKQVRPLLAGRCQKCHGGTKTKGGLKLTSRQDILAGGDSGPAAVVGRPDKSLLIRAIHHQGDIKMPPKLKLPDREVAALTRWVEMGLPWPETRGGPPGASGAQFHIREDQRKFWCFQPVRKTPPPPVRDVSWPKTGVDRFILARLEARGLRPAEPADRRTLIRRATFDLTGLPPTPQEVDAFVRDRSPGAFARVIDRLLTSPRYGERWARHWLDVVRYTDSFDARILSGPGSVMDITEAWRYRDWVVDALNRDLPYDRFITDQIAGDLVPAERPGEVNARGIIATGFLAVGNWGGGDADKEKLLTDIADDQVDVVGRAFLSLTVACARCHDHKFDPISTADYYGLAGIFFSTHILPNVGPKTDGPPMLRIPLASPAELVWRRERQKRIAELDNQFKQATDREGRRFARKMLDQTGRYLAGAWEFEHLPAAETERGLADFAARRGLYAYALRQWRDYLGLGDYRLMTKPVANVLGNAGVHAWRGEPDCPSLTVNTNPKPVTILTFRLPPHSVAVHPGPRNGVAVGWRSPVSGTVRITGRVADADPVAGDGVAWAIDHRTAGGRRQLASGGFANGGAQKFADGKDARRLESITVKAGDMIELLVLPKANHTCDTTVVDLVIARPDGSLTWDLTRDVLDAPHQIGKGNPHGDRFGNKAVWHFSDMADNFRGRVPAGAGAASLAQWHRLVAEAAGKALAPDKLASAAAAFRKQFARAEDQSPFRIRQAADRSALPAASRAALARLAGELEALRKNQPPPVEFANGAQDGGVPGSPHAGVHDVRIHVRGRYARLGERVPRRFPVILAGDKQPSITHGSGRLELARWIAGPAHPLTARVIVNRVWQHHFGEGIVRTPSNFGKLGERPTHPELLDWLATEFVRSGWSIKHMHRLMMLSAAYQQSSEPPAATLKADPDNRFFGRMNRRRLEAEAIRDNLLAVAGRLDGTMGGRAIRDFSGRRRTLYLLTVRSDRSGFRPLFDVADSTAPVDKRAVSTVAPQALFLLNHPFVLEQTLALARRTLTGSRADQANVRALYELLFARPPTEAEAGVGQEFLARARAAGRGAEAAWREYCQVLLCTNEFIYVD
jgi:cytochrome c553